MAQNGIECARLAQRGITGPKNFLEGVYGYFHLFGRDRFDVSKLTEGLGRRWLMDTLSFKKYPSCGQTQGSVELLEKLMDENSLTADDLETVEVLINPFTSKLVGKPFEPGDNPKVDAQFNVGYCVANAAVRRPVVLQHFEPQCIFDERVLAFYHDRVRVIVVPELHERGHYSSAMRLICRDGRQLEASIDIPPGSIGNELKEEDYVNRFYDCIRFSELPWMNERADIIFNALGRFENIEDLGRFTALFGEDGVN